MMPVQMCRGFTGEQWRTIRLRLDKGDESAWPCAVEVFERRIKERYLSCIEVLIAADSKLDVGVPDEAPADCSTLPDDLGRPVVVPGFAILALCCLLAETLQGFREKPAKTNAPSGPCAFQDDGKCIKPTTTDQAHGEVVPSGKEAGLNLAERRDPEQRVRKPRRLYTDPWDQRPHWWRSTSFHRPIPCTSPR